MIAAKANGFSEVQARLAAIRAGARGSLPDVVNTAAEKAIVEKIKARAPKKSGRLAGRIYVVPIEMGNRDQGLQVKSMLYGYITVEVFYARYQEYGTQHQPARPFIRPVLDAELSEFWDTVAMLAFRGLEVAALATGQVEIDVAAFVLEPIVRAAIPKIVGAL